MDDNTYTGARRYEISLGVFNSIPHSFTALTVLMRYKVERQKIYIPYLCVTFRPLTEDSRRLFKNCLKATRHFMKTTED